MDASYAFTVGIGMSFLRFVPETGSFKPKSDDKIGMYWYGFISVLLLGLVLTIGAFIFYRRQWSEGAIVRQVLENVTIVLFGFFITFGVLEFYFKVFFAQTDGYTFTLAARNWHEKYWYPINSLGYRDWEWIPESGIGKTKVIVVGDSFVAGTGIKDHEDRFSNQLAKLLGQDYVVFNVASPGWSTQDEIKALVAYPYKPNILILSYFVNDIEQTVYDQGIERPEFIRRPTGVWGFIVDNSYAFNFLYWRWYRLTQPPPKPTYLEWINSLYRDPKLWWLHRQELLTIIEGAASEQIPLLVVVFPNLAAIEESQFISQPVIDLFQEHNVPVLDVSMLLAGHDPAEITVNAVDAHPNEAVHLEVAEHLYQMIQDIR